MVDIKNERCKRTGCNTQPTFGTVWRKPVHCKAHADDGEVDVVNDRCVVDGCETFPSFGPRGGKAVHCADHMDDDDVDLVHKRCIGRGDDGCPHDARARYGPHCVNCTPDVTRAKVRKETETRCFAVIKKQLGSLVAWREQLYVDFRRATNPPRTCAYVDAELSHASIRVLLEIDERRHDHEDSAKELARMRCVEEVMRLSDPRYIAWVRFNPDDGDARASANEQKRRCHDAAAVIRGLVADPRNDILYVNYE